MHNICHSLNYQQYNRQTNAGCSDFGCHSIRRGSGCARRKLLEFEVVSSYPARFAACFSRLVFSPPASAKAVSFLAPAAQRTPKHRMLKMHAPSPDAQRVKHSNLGSPTLCSGTLFVPVPVCYDVRAKYLSFQAHLKKTLPGKASFRIV